MYKEPTNLMKKIAEGGSAKPRHRRITLREGAKIVYIWRVGGTVTAALGAS